MNESDKSHGEGAGAVPHDRPGGSEWFARPDPASGATGLSFSCTMCGNCCTGPEGYVLVTEAETAALAARLGIDAHEFLARFTKTTEFGRSLTEKASSFGHDCVFLDREKIPGRAVCGVYEDRPTQCRTWPFWKTIIQSRAHWERVKRTCPGIDRGPRYTVQQIRVLRDTMDM